MSKQIPENQPTQAPPTPKPAPFFARGGKALIVHTNLHAGKERSRKTEE